MYYYVVNARAPWSLHGALTGRSADTHIMRSKNSSLVDTSAVSALASLLLAGGGTPKRTLCGQIVLRYVDCFAPSEASCRECKKRWRIAAEKELAE